MWPTLLHFTHLLGSTLALEVHDHPQGYSVTDGVEERPILQTCIKTQRAQLRISDKLAAMAATGALMDKFLTHFDIGIIQSTVRATE